MIWGTNVSFDFTLSVFLGKQVFISEIILIQTPLSIYVNASDYLAFNNTLDVKKPLNWYSTFKHDTFLQKSLIKLDF